MKFCYINIKKYFWFAILCSLALIAYFIHLRLQKNDKVNDVIIQLIGQKIVFPKEDLINKQIYASLDSVLTTCDYTIVSYVDTSYCYSCRLQLNKWREYISEVSDKKRKVFLLFVFDSSLRNETEKLLKIASWDFPVIYDNNEKFKKRNNVPNDYGLQTFLLNKNKEIVAIGNPIYYPQIKKFYNKTMKVDSVSTGTTDVSFSKNRIEYGKMRDNSYYIEQIVIRNIGKQKLRVLDVSTSCDCIETALNCIEAFTGDSILLSVKAKVKDNNCIMEKIFLRLNTEPQVYIIKVEGNK